MKRQSNACVEWKVKENLLDLNRNCNTIVFMKNVIPTVIEVICDVCGDKKNNYNFRCDANLKLKRNGLDGNNIPVGDASSEYDLCDECAIHIEVMLKNLNGSWKD